MTPSVILLIALTVVVALLAVYRSIVARNEDDLVHVADPSGDLARTQGKIARTLSTIDRAGMVLTIATAVYGLALLGMGLYDGLKM